MSRRSAANRACAASSCARAASAPSADLGAIKRLDEPQLGLLLATAQEGDGYVFDFGKGSRSGQVVEGAIDRIEEVAGREINRTSPIRPAVTRHEIDARIVVAAGGGEAGGGPVDIRRALRK